MAKQVSILFVGNSHTYYNDMPILVRQHAAADGYDCRVTMIAHGNWYLHQHVKEPDVRFNILFGHYDYVVIQEHTLPMATEEEYLPAAKALNEWIGQAGSTPVVYETWARKEDPDKQPSMHALNQKVAEEIGALLAPVGQQWWGYRASRPDLELYAPDDRHASWAGSDFAAGIIWKTIRSDVRRKEKAQ